MGDHLVLRMGHAITPATESVQNVEPSGSSREAVRLTISSATFFAGKGNDDNFLSDEEEPLIQTVECRICQEEDCTENLEVPCNCSGSLKVFDFFTLSYP